MRLQNTIAGSRRLPRFSRQGRDMLLGRLGNLEIRLAANQREVRQAQSLRFEVFCGELSARPGLGNRMRRLERDRWDRICDHLVVFDTSDVAPRAVATYRLLPGWRIGRNKSGFYSESEFDIRPMLQGCSHLKFLELGRSCVRDGWRTKRTLELLWHGTWKYVGRERIDVMFGCASFPGTDPQLHAESLSYLRQVAPPDEHWDVRALPDRAATYEKVAPDRIDRRKALTAMPPLIKGYLRLGAWIGRDAVIDHRFGTTDVMIILPVSRLNPRYVNFYGHAAERHSAPQP